jgi:hypothetical protein
MVRTLTPYNQAAILTFPDATDHNKVVDVPLPVHVDPKTTSKKSLQQANDWLRICRKNHQTCRAVDSEPKKTPKRLIFIDRTSTSIKVQLCETRKLKKKPQYMALSHCWGKTLEARLVRKNYDAYLKEIPQEALPQVFRDTFQLAGQAGISYVLDRLTVHCSGFIEPGRPDKRGGDYGVSVQTLFLQCGSYRLQEWRQWALLYLESLTYFNLSALSSRRTSTSTCPAYASMEAEMTCSLVDIF